MNMHDTARFTTPSKILICVKEPLTMPLELQPLTKEDAAEATRLVIASYENNPFRKIIFPSGMLKASIDKIEKSKYDAVEDPDQYPWKVIDTDTGEMAACATWAYTNAMSDEDWDQRRSCEWLAGREA